MLPLLGLLGGVALGGLEMGREGIMNRRMRQDGNNRRRAYDRGAGAEEMPMGGLFGGNQAGSGDPMRRGGPGDTKFNESGALYYGGADIDTNNFLSQRYQQDLQTQQERAAMARQQVASGPGYMNAQLNRDKFNLEKQTAEDLAAQTKQANQWMIENFGSSTTQSLNQNPFITPAIENQLSTDAYNNAMAAKPNAVLAQEADIRGKPWVTDMTPENRQEIYKAEDGLRNMREARNFFNQTNALERGAAGGMSEESREQAASWMYQSLNFLRKGFEAGAMQEADLELFERIAGNPDSYLNLTDGDMGRMNMIIKEAEDRLTGINKSFGLGASGRSEVTYTNPTTGGALVPIDASDVGDALNEAGQGFVAPDARGGGGGF